MQTFLDSKAMVQQKMLERQFDDTMGEQGQGEERHVEKSKTHQEAVNYFV